MGSSFRHDDHIPFLEMKGVSAFDRCTSKFTGSDLSHPDSLAANHERGRAIDDIEKIGVIGVKLDLLVVSLIPSSVFVTFAAFCSIFELFVPFCGY